MAILVVDNSSPFVKDITLCLDKIGQDYVLKKYYEDFKVSNFEKVILSGRQKYKKEINSVNSKIIKTCFANETPILGICYGAEIIALTFGGSIHKTDQVQGLNRIKITLPSILLKETHCNVYESHSYAISHLPENFICIASSSSAKHEIFCHSSKRIFGTQFHPEKSGHSGTELIRNFILKLDNEHTLILPLVENKTDHVCLPLAINVILNYWGEYDFEQEAEQRSKKYNDIKGSIFIEGIEIAENHGFLTHIFKNDLLGLKKKIDQGIPSIVIMPGLKETIQHATVVTGYDPNENRIITYVPEPDTVGSIPEKKFLELWEQDGSISITIIPKDMKEINNNDNSAANTDLSYRLCFEAERLLLSGNQNKAVEKIKRAIEINGSNEFALDMIGSIYNELKSDEAKDYFEASIKLNSKFYLAYRGIGNYYLRKEQYGQAEKYYSTAISINPTRFGSIYKNRGIARLKLNDNNGAKSDLISYLDKCPQAHDKNNIELAIKELSS